MPDSFIYYTHVSLSINLHIFLTYITFLHSK